MQATHASHQPPIRSTGAARRRVRKALALATLMAAATARAAAGTDVDAAYQQEVAACHAGKTAEALTTCLKEAGAARDQARAGRLGDKGAAYDKNATARCKSLAGDDRADCVARIQGDGTTSGSVQGGGILRERVTTQVVPASAPTR